MEFKGTKGHWLTREMEVIKCESYYKIISEVNKTEVARADNKANAQLIAAAPELLEACKLALHQVNTGTSLIRIDLLEDAINKALGK